MTRTVEPAVLGRFSEFLCARTGLSFSPDRWDDMERGILAAAAEFGFDEPDACAEWLMSSPLNESQIATLASHLTVGETYFFRETRSFDIFRNQLLPELIRSRRGQDQRLRIWSAGCCTGEEAYSIAIAVSQALPEPRDWNVLILATDINPRFLKKAQAGLFGEWSFRDVASPLKEQYFTQVGLKQYQIRPDLKKLVRFRYLNLVEDTYPAIQNETNAMDFIFCRNVLMYFSPEHIHKIQRRFEMSLIESGWLIVSATETSLFLKGELARVPIGEMTFYQKRSASDRQEREKTDAALPPAFWTVPEPLADEQIAQDSGIMLKNLFAEHPASSIEESRAEETPEALPEPLALAKDLYDRGLYAEAFAVSQPWVDTHEIDADAIALLARAQANMGNLDAAMQCCDRAIAQDKLKPDWHFLRGGILEEKGQWIEAANAYRRSLYLDPKFVMAHVALGHLARREQKPRDARRHWDNALILIQKLNSDEIVRESDGLTAARLAQLIAPRVASKGAGK